MGKGVDAVKAAIVTQLNSPTIQVEDFGTEDRKLTITADGRKLVVLIAWEFDEDFGNATRVDLRRLGHILLTVGKVRIGPSGISAIP